MQINILSLDQRRHFINASQLAEELRKSTDDYERRFNGYMVWKKIHGEDYLTRRVRGRDMSLGVRSPDTETAFAQFRLGKEALQESIRGLRLRLSEIAPRNRAEGIARMPTIVARLLRALDRRKALGELVRIVGTHALWAYEAKAGIQFDAGLLATEDLDVALDGRKRLSLASRMVPDGLLALLREVDASFRLTTTDHVPSRGVATALLSRVGCSVRLPGMAS